MNDKLPTIKLQGKEYVQVKDRVLYFNDTYPNGSITTEADYGMTKSAFVWIKAIVTPDVDKPARYFIGRSGGLVDEDKSYEKLETVAVGRALAMMGIGVIESIASSDEIHQYEQRKSVKIPYSSEKSEEAVDELKLPPCHKCGTGKFRLINGKNGPFYSCGNYKSKGCRATLDMEAAEQLALSFAHDTKPSKKGAFSDGTPLPTDLPF